MDRLVPVTILPPITGSAEKFAISKSNTNKSDKLTAGVFAVIVAPFEIIILILKN
jgi:hypothetical protein